MIQFSAKSLVMVLMAGLSVSACAKASDNMLIGKWKLTNEECVGDKWEVYTDTTFAGYDDHWRHMDVGYNVSAEEIWVMPIQDGHPYAPLARKMIPLDANHFKADAPCAGIYERVDAVGIPEQ